MTIELINPSGPPQPRGYAPVGMGTGRHTIFLSGQVARTADGTPVGAGDLAAQVEQAYLNVVAALAGAGAIFADLVKLTVYVVDWSPEKMGALVEGATRVATRLGIDPVRPMTLIGVAALGKPDLLVEVAGVVILDRARSGWLWW